MDQIPFAVLSLHQIGMPRLLQGKGRILPGSQDGTSRIDFVWTGNCARSGQGDRMSERRPPFGGNQIITAVAVEMPENA